MRKKHGTILSLRAALVGLVLATTATGILAQVGQKQTQTDIRDFLPQTKELPAAQPAGVALEAVVDPETYFVGPSDGIAVNIWVSPPLTYALTVTPEGTLIIPTVGEVRVAGLTLAKTKEAVITEAQRKYLHVTITATLIRPRPIVVTVSGAVLNPGLYTLTAVDRATKAIEESNKPARLAQQENLQKIADEMSRRNIVIRHRDGSQDRVDLVKFLATKKDLWNPYLREGDLIVVPRRDPRQNVIGIYGEVNSPGRYEFVEGDRISDALQIAQGFTRLALLDSIEFSRLSLDGTQMTRRIFNLNDFQAGGVPDLSLEPGDRLLIRARRDFREDYVVTLQGEIQNPGKYPITKDRTTLSEILRQAGGVTEFAALQSAELNRNSFLNVDVTTEKLLSLRGGVPLEDSLDYNLENDLRLRKEIVNVDFEKLLVEGDSSQDVILQDGDNILIPSVKKTIYVFGQVVSPGHIAYIRGEKPEYYILKAGGFTDRARRDDLKVIKSRTKQWLDPDETAIEEGDYVWIPKEPERPFAYYMTVTSQAASILSVIIGMTVVILQVTK